MRDLSKRSWPLSFFENDPDFVHLHSSEHEKFDKHTPESFAQLAAELKDVAQNRPGELADHEQASGLKYDPYAVPWDDEVRAKLAPPLNHFPDWMHTFPGSGGLAQYNVNAFVLQLSDYDISAEDIDLWCRDVHLPLSMTRLSKTFFRDRIVQRAGAHMRAFASEVLTAFVLLGFFCRLRRAARGRRSFATFFGLFRSSQTHFGYLLPRHLSGDPHTPQRNEGISPAVPFPRVPSHREAPPWNTLH